MKGTDTQKRRADGNHALCAAEHTNTARAPEADQTP